MSNGNIYVNASSGQGGAGVMYEVDSLGTIVWGPYNAQSQKGFRYECDYPGIIALEPYINTLGTSCFNVSSVLDNTLNNLVAYPNPTKDYITVDGKGIKQIYNTLGVRLLITDKNEIDLRDLKKGVYIMKLEEKSLRIIKQ